MSSPYDLITITYKDIDAFRKYRERSKIGIIMHLILDELPSKLKPKSRFVFPYLRPIEGFEDEYVCGYEIAIDENKRIEKFVQDFVPFFILKKK